MANEGLKELIPYAVNFSLFSAAVFVLARKPVKNFVYKRHERMKDFVLDAAKEKQDALERHSKISKKLDKIAQEETGILQSAAQEGRQEAAAILEKANVEAKRIASDAEMIVQNEAMERDKQLTRALLDAASGKAEQFLSKQLKKEDHSGLVKRAKSVIEAGV